MIRLGVFTVLLGTALVAALVYMPGPVLSMDETGWDALSELDRYRLEAQLRTTILQALGALVVVVGAITGFRQLTLARQQTVLDRRAKLVDAFARAVEQLESSRDSSRVAGLYALDRIASLDATESARIVEIIGAFIREGKGEHGSGAV